MKASLVIEKLQAAVAKYGDVECLFEGCQVDALSIADYRDGKKKITFHICGDYYGDATEL